jgi:hypothetical protein
MNFAYEKAIDLPTEGLDNVASWWSRLSERESVKAMIPG